MRIDYIHDERCALLPLREDHIPELLRWVNDRGVLHYLDHLGGLAPEQERQFIERLRSNDNERVFGIETRDEAEPRMIGTVGLHRIDQRSRNAEFGILIGEKELWGKGYGTAACRLICDFGFNTLNLHRIWLRVFDFNPRGIASYVKAGFVEEGRAREAIFRDDSYHDVVHMSMLREEFNSKWADWRAEQRRRYGVE